MNRFQTASLIVGLALLLSPSTTRAADAHAFQAGGNATGSSNEPAAFRTFGNGWTSTSSGFSFLGAPVDATWSIVPNGTLLPGSFVQSSGSSGGVNSPSDIISFLDTIHHAGNSPGGADLTQRDWFELFEMSFNRWDELSGVDFQYESNDDGAPLSSANRGTLGVRGDHRIGGHSLDGQTSPTILAFNFFPNNSDMVIDTDEVNRWGNGSGNFLRFRNMLMHEIGHGLGINHVESRDVNPTANRHQFGTFLMEPILATVFDGPQLDDILAVHRLYGDANEEDGGNENSANATSLGPLSFGVPIAIGTDVDDTAVAFTDIDFVSIDDNSDIDVFRFTVNAPSFVDILLTPKGPEYLEGPQGSGNGGTQQLYDSSAQSDLSLELLGLNGFTSLELSNQTGIGESEDILALRINTPGDYFVRIRGSQNTVQLYQLDLSAVPVPEPSACVLLGIGFATLLSRRSRTSRMSQVCAN